MKKKDPNSKPCSLSLNAFNHSKKSNLNPSTIFQKVNVQNKSQNLNRIFQVDSSMFGGRVIAAILTNIYRAEGPFWWKFNILSLCNFLSGFQKTRQFWKWLILIVKANSKFQLNPAHYVGNPSATHFSIPFLFHLSILFEWLKE